jgi:hypothetical protein
MAELARTDERVFFRKEQKLEPPLPLVFCFVLGYQTEEGIRLQIFRFFGGWVWSKGKKKGRHGRMVSDRHGHPLVLRNFSNYMWCSFFNILKLGK